MAPEYVGELAFSPDGKSLACLIGMKSEAGVAVWDLATRKIRATLQRSSDPIVSMVWTPDSRTLITANNTARSPKGVVLWDAATGQQRKRLAMPASLLRIRALALAPDGHTLAVIGQTVGLNSRIPLWDIRTGELLGHLPGPTSSLTCVAFSPDGRTLVLGAEDTTVSLWDLPEAKR